MPDFEKLFNVLKAALEWVFGKNVPPQITKFIGYFVLITVSLAGLWLILFLAHKIIDLIKEKFIPLFYKADETRRAQRRRLFADHIESEIRRLNSLEDWKDYRFTELEAEVEAEGRRRLFGLQHLFSRSISELRRERSLSRALERSQERLILVEGDPGSGKSVAMRHVTQQMAQRAMKSRNAKSIIPIYINLKGLDRRRSEKIDRNLISTYVLQSLNRINDRDVEEFLETEFERGTKEGTWLFLFDSFDEIPEVLSSTDADELIKSYGQAISDFLHGMNLCRGIIASRQFRGPGQLGWPRFRLLPLSEKRRQELVKKASHETELQEKIIGHLGIIDHEFRYMTSNPMFLGLLCEHVRAGNPFPENTHSIFETYLSARLERDREKLKRRYNLNPSEVREVAEKVAFCMAADIGLGLSPTRQEIKAATERINVSVGKRFETMLDALEYIKLARAEAVITGENIKPFTFAHRRFQEYFATCIVLREPERITPRQLLTDARWRETAVVMCQTQSSEILLPLIQEAHVLLIEMNRQVPNLIEHPLDYIQIDESKLQLEVDEKELLLPKPFTWPMGAIHLMGLLQDGFRNRLKELSDDIRINAGALILTADSQGTLLDRKWGLDVAGIVPQPILLHILREAFGSSSQWLRDVAFRQVARLSDIPHDIAKQIRVTLIRLTNNKRLWLERRTTRSHLKRLDKAEEFLNVNRLLLSAGLYDLFLHMLAFPMLLAEIAKSKALASWLSHQRIFRSFMGSFEATYWEQLSVILLISHLGFYLGIPYLVGVMGVRGTLSSENTFSRMPQNFSEAGRFILSIKREIVTQFKRNFIPEVFSAATISILFTVGFVCRVWAFIIISPRFTLFPIVTVWPYFAYWAARMGEFTHPLQWPLISIAPAVHAIINFRTLTQKMIIFARNNWRQGIFFSMFSLFLFIITIAWQKISSKIPILPKLLLLVICVIISLLFCIALTDLIHDNKYWRDWIRRTKRQLSGREFLDILASYRTRSYSARFVRDIRINGLLVSNEETNILLVDLVRVIEWQQEYRSEAHNLKKELILSGVSNNFKKWYTEAIKKGSISLFDATLLDEILALLEQTHSKQHPLT